MPDYRFVLLYRKQDGAILINIECRDDNHACMVGRRLTLPPYGHAEVWAGSRFVRVVNAAMEVRQDAEPLPAAANAVAYFFAPVRAKRGRAAGAGAAAAQHRAAVPHSLPVHKSYHAHAPDRNNWVLLIVVGLAALAAPLLTGGP
jgi:hypothetical protein